MHNLDQKRLWAIVPARSGSKGLPHKNIRPLAGTPLLSHAIRFARKSGYFEQVMLSTDSEDYARIGREHGAWVPFLRRAEAARDSSMEEDILADLHAQLATSGIAPPDAVVWLRPTFPFRAQKDLTEALELLTDEVDSVRLVTEGEPRLYAINDGFLTAQFEDGNRSMVRRQEFAPSYKVFHTDIFWYRNIQWRQRFLGQRVKAVPVHKICSSDVDSIEDFEMIEAVMASKPSFIEPYIN